MPRFQVYIIIVVIVAVSVALAFFYPSLSGNRNLPQAEELSQEEDLSTLVENAKFAVKKNAILALPNPVSSVKATQDELPDDLAALIETDAQRLQIKKTTFSDKSTGYKITYGLGESIDDSGLLYRRAILPKLSQLGWVSVYQSYANHYSLVELENNNYLVSLEREFKGENRHLVEITALSK